jgi:hypothetical protein
MESKFEFAYCFAINDYLNWSAETANSLLLRFASENDRSLVEDFIESAVPGSFVILSPGELVFCIKAL